MDKETRYERIEAYLEGRLPDPERQAFEQQMAADPGLAAEVELHRRLERVVSDREKRAFRQKLAELAAEFPSPPAGRAGWKGFFRFGGLLLALLAAVVLWQYLRREPAVPEAPPAIAQDTLVETEAPPPSLPEPPATPQAETPPAAPVPEPQPFAANPGLEAELALAKDAYYTVDGPSLQALPGNAAGRWLVRFAGLLLTAMEPPELELLVLDNRRPAGQEQARLPVALTLLEEEGDIRAFAAKKDYRMAAEQEVRLPPGLYYARLLRKGQEASLWTGRVEVR